MLASALTFTGSEDAALRATGAGVLAELCNLDGDWGADVLDILAPLLARERQIDVIRIALHGVGLTQRPDGVAVALPFAAHADAGVRLDATHALYSCAGEPAAEDAVAALIALDADPDEHVRDWATFGLGTRLEVDSHDVRAALAARLADPFLDAREEAAIGLARRGDRRSLDTVLELLEAEEVSALTVEAAGYLADERFLRPLIELGEWWEDEPDLLRAAIDRCDPVAQAAFDAHVRSLVEQIERSSPSEEPRAQPRVGRARSRRHAISRPTSRSPGTTRAGGSHEAVWVVEELLARSDVRHDPARAASVVIAATRRTG